MYMTETYTPNMAFAFDVILGPNDNFVNMLFLIFKFGVIF